MEFKAGQVVRHHKGKLFIILCISERWSARLPEVVIMDVETNCSRVLTLSTFCKPVDVDGEIKQRFTVVGNASVFILDNQITQNYILDNIAMHMKPYALPRIIIQNDKTKEQLIVLAVDQHATDAIVLSINDLEKDEPRIIETVKSTTELITNYTLLEKDFGEGCRVRQLLSIYDRLNSPTQSLK